MKVLTYDGYEYMQEEVRSGKLEDYYRTIGCDLVEIHVWAFGKPDGMPVAVILDEEGKLTGKDTSGILMHRYESGREEVFDLLAGKMIIAGVARNGDLRSLTEREMERIMANASPVFYF